MKNLLKMLVIFAMLASFATAEIKAVINDLDGEVYVNKADAKELIVAEADMELEEGDVIITKQGGRAEILLDSEDSMINVMENTQLVITKLENTKTEQKTFLELISGGLVNIINKAVDVKKVFEVKTPNAVAAVKGTQFGVEALDRESTVGVFEGEVLVNGVDAGGKDLGEVAVTKDNECRMVLNQHDYKPEKFRNRMAMVYGAVHKKAVANLELYASLRKNGDFDKIRQARKIMMFMGLKDYIRNNPDWKSKATPEQLARIEMMLKSGRALGEIQKLREVMKKYPFMIDKFKRMQMEKIKREQEMKERSLPKDFLDKRDKMQKWQRPNHDQKPDQKPERPQHPGKR